MIQRNTAACKGSDPQIDLGADGPSPNDPIDADDGANHGQNYPVLAQASFDAGVLTVAGEPGSSPNLAGVRIELFGGGVCSAAGYGEARYFLGFTTVSTNAAGSTPFTVRLGPIPPGVAYVTATATTAAGDTSELSQCVAVTQPAPLSSGREPGAGSSLTGSGRPAAPGRRVSARSSTGPPTVPAPSRRQGSASSTSRCCPPTRGRLRYWDRRAARRPLASRLPPLPTHGSDGR
ncbi:MAG: hypothetical protein U0821_22370 [Chloroflexota bacterium]